MSAAKTESAYKKAAHLFESIDEYQDSAVLAQSCYEKAEIARKDTILSEGKSKMSGEIISNYESAIKLFETISGWRDADEQIIACQRKIEETKAKEEAERLEKERKAEIERKEAERIAKRNKNATQDQVFLLSITEANKYFSSYSARQCEPTDYAVANGAWESGNGNCYWQLRSPGDWQNTAAYVYSDGDVSKSGHRVDLGSTAVRPALWIDLNS